MLTPGIFHIRIKDKTTLDLDFYVKNEDGSAKDLTGYTVAAGAEGGSDWIPDGYIDLNASIVTPASGHINVSLTAAQVGALSVGSSEIPLWDLLLTENATAKVLAYVEGEFEIRKTATRVT